MTSAALAPPATTAATCVSRAGGLTAADLRALARAGFVTILNLREAHEVDAAIDQQAAAVAAAGLRFVHLPISAQTPDPSAIDVFLQTVTSPEHAPVLIHCRSGNRAAALWSIKLMLIDGWAAERAFAEAERLGLTSPFLRQFALDAIAARLAGPRA